MNDQNQNKPKQRPEETPKKALGGASAANSSSGWKRLFAKRWVSPAIFMAAAAIIVTLMWIYQGTDQAKETTGSSNPTDVTQGEEMPAQNEVEKEEPDVTASGKMMQWPVLDRMALQVDTPFFDAQASASEREEALIQVGTTFMPHTGIDFVEPDGQAFDVVAALSGKVVSVQKHPKNGNTVEINHGEGLVTVYQSVTDVQVAEGDEIEQGTVFAKAGQNDIESDLGVHLHFETRLNGESVNPGTYISE